MHLAQTRYQSYPKCMTSQSTAVKIKGYENSPTAVGKMHGSTPVGQWRYYYPHSGKLWQVGRYDENWRKNGVWKVYDDLGVLAAEITYSGSRQTKIKWTKGAIDLGHAMTTDIFFVPGIEVEQTSHTI